MNNLLFGMDFPNISMKKLPAAMASSQHYVEWIKYIITTRDPLTAVPNGIYDSSSYLSLLI